MTETEIKTEGTSKKRKLLLPAVIVIVGLLVIGFIASQAGLDKVLVKQRLDEVIATIKEQGKAQGSDIEITYSDIEMAGGLMGKHIIVHDPALKVQPLQKNPNHDPNSTESVLVTTPEMIIYPKAVDLSSATYSLPQPLNLADAEHPEKSLLKMESSTPFDVTLTQVIENNATHLKTSHTPPKTIKLTYLRVQTAEGVEDKTPEVTPVYQTMAINIGDGSHVDSDFVQDESGIGTADVVYKQLSLVPDTQPEGAITVAAIESHWSNKLDEKGLNAITVKSQVGPITADPAVLPHAPIALGIDFAFEGPMTQPAEGTTTGEARDSIIKLNKFEFTTKDVSLIATADFTATPSDILPVGKAGVKIVNMPLLLSMLRQNQAITSTNEKWVIPALEKIAGAPVTTLKDVDIAISRERQGSFIIGKTTFDELFAMILKSALGKTVPPEDGQESAPQTAPGVAPQSRALVPQLPPADKKRLAPIEVPDNSVRG